MKTSKKYFAGAVVLVVVVAVGWSLRQRRPTLPLKRGPIVESVYGLGTVTPQNSFNLKVGVASTVRRLYVTEGDIVKTGSPLVALESTALFRAPWDGTITAVNLKEGETVFANSTILTLMDLRHPYLLVSLEQQGAMRVKVGQSARLSFESLRGQHFTGKVRSIYPGAGNTAGQFLVRIDVVDLPTGILPGMTADVAIEIAQRTDALLAPVQALNNGKITLLRNGRAQKIDVQVGTVDGEWAEILSGDIKAEDRALLPK